MLRAFFLVVLIVGALAAECIGPQTACGAFAMAKHVFVAEAIENEPLEVDEYGTPLRVRARLRIERIFKGLEAYEIGDEVDTEQWRWEAWINPQPGERFLVFASRDGLELDMCANTARLDFSYPLELIEQIATGGQPPDLFVTVRSLADDYGRVAGAEFRFLHSQLSASGVTEEEGAFSVRELAAGHYAIQASKEGFKPESIETYVSEEGCASASIWLYPDNRATGRLLLTDGSPANKGFITIDGASEAFARYRRSKNAYTQRNGGFEFHGLEPGFYTVSVPFPKQIGSRGLTAAQAAQQVEVYYPGTTNKDEAEILWIGGNTQLDLGDFRLPDLDQ